MTWEPRNYQTEGNINETSERRDPEVLTNLRFQCLSHTITLGESTNNSKVTIEQKSIIIEKRSNSLRKKKKKKKNRLLFKKKSNLLDPYTDTTKTSRREGLKTYVVKNSVFGRSLYKSGLGLI